MDVDSVFAGAKYKDLNETYVIFLCLGDAFGFNLPVYTFENVCAENSEIKMNDGTHKIFFNAKKYDTMKSEELKSFFKYLCGKEPTSDFSEKISAIVERLKMNARRRHEYMTWQEEVELQADLAAKKAREETSEKIRIETARNLIEMSLEPEKIAKATNLPIEQVLALQKQFQTVKA